jgi:hypothetical protein
MSNITYLLGAGASAKSIPTYTSDNYNFTIQFSIFISNYFDTNDSPIKEFNSKNEYLIKIILEIRKELLSKDYSSIDVYANVLYTRTNSNFKFRLLKALISFYIEYLQIPGNLISSQQLDDRYTKFFTNLRLIKSTNFPTFPPHIKIVSWNYDNQIEIALSKFSEYTLNFRNIQNDYGFFPKHCEIGALNQNSFDSNIVKLNGHANCFLIYEETKNSIREITSLEYEHTLDSFKDRMIRILAEFSNNYRSMGIDLLINFAFEHEKNHYSKLACNLAQQIYNNTDLFIVIGYSFDPANDIIDQTLFSNIKEGAKVLYQTLDLDSREQEKKVMRIIKNCSDKNIQIHHISRHDNFILPNEAEYLINLQKSNTLTIKNFN